MKYWEIIVSKIIKAGLSVGWVLALENYGRTIWIVDAHRDGKRFVMRADEKLTAFVELEMRIYEFALDLEQLLCVQRTWSIIGDYLLDEGIPNVRLIDAHSFCWVLSAAAA
jgi:hypothetical protein